LTTIALVFRFCPGLTSESFWKETTAFSITSLSFSLLGFISEKVPRWSSEFLIEPFEISTTEPSFSSPFSMSSMWFVSQRIVRMFEVSSARRKETTFPCRLFLLNSLTGFSWIIFPRTLTLFIPWTISESFSFSWSKFIPSSAAIIWAAPSLEISPESFARLASIFLSISSFFRLEALTTRSRSLS